MLVRYFVNDEWAARGSQPISSIFEQIARPSGWRAAFFDQLNSPIERGALSAILERMTSDGLLRVTKSDDHDEPHYEASYDIQKHPRFKYLYSSAEDRIANNSALSGEHQANDLVQDPLPLPPGHDYLTTEDGDYLTTENGEYLTVESEPPVSSPRVDPVAWTGTHLIYVDGGVLAQIRARSRELQALAHGVNYRSSEDQHDLQRLSDALVSLCDMAQPDVSIIVQILAHPKFKIYASLFAAAATIRGALGI